MRKETVENPYLSEEVAETEIVFVLMFDDLIVNIGILYLKVIVKSHLFHNFNHGHLERTAYKLSATKI